MRKNNFFVNLNWRVLIIWAAATAVFWPTLKTYFLQDDWMFLSFVADKPFTEIFVYQAKAIYRPLGQQLFFWMGWYLFGLNSIGYHLMGLVIHFVNIWLLWKLLAEKSRNRFAAVMWYAVNPLHFVALNWLTQINLEITVIWTLLSLLSARNCRRSWLGFVFYMAALLSHEIALLLPLFLFFWRRNRRFIWWLAVGVAVFATKYLINPFPLDEDYQVVFAFNSWFSQFRWYLWRALGLVEGWKNLAVEYRLVGLGLPLWLVWRWRWGIIPAVTAYFIGLGPVLALTSHPLEAYGTVGAVLMVLLLAKHFRGRPGKKMFDLFWLIMVSGIIVREIYPNHWTTRRSEISREVTEKMTAVFSKNDNWYITSETEAINREVYFATLEGIQLQVISARPDLKITFSAFETIPAGAEKIKL